MARPREFDRQAALRAAMNVFWAKGFAATSTEDLVQEMGIGRQSLYNAFGDKRRLYIEALGAYQRESTAAHVRRLKEPESPLDGIRSMLLGLIGEDDALRAKGCMGVGSIGEFGATDPELLELRAKAAAPLREQLLARLRDAKQKKEIDPDLVLEEAAGFIQLTMTGIQLAARAGASADELRRMAQFAAERLRAR